MEVNPKKLSDNAWRDYDLIKRAKGGDEYAFARLLELYKDNVYYMLLKKLKHPVDAEDVTIEAFGKAFKNLHKYEPRGAFSTWLLKIANNNCIDFVRKKRDNVFYLDDNIREGNGETSYECVSDVLDPEERLIKEQKSDLLEEVIQELKPRYSKLIRLRYYKELSYKEIAEEMQLTLGAVKSQLYRSKELLKAMLYPDTEDFK